MAEHQHPCHGEAERRTFTLCIGKRERLVSRAECPAVTCGIQRRRYLGRFYLANDAIGKALIVTGLVIEPERWAVEVHLNIELPVSIVRPIGTQLDRRRRAEVARS